MERENERIIELNREIYKIQKQIEEEAKERERVEERERNNKKEKLLRQIQTRK